MAPEDQKPRETLADVFIKEWIKAIPWVLTVFFLVLFFLMGAKQNIKEGIEFTSKQIAVELRAMVSDPDLKQDIKEAMQFMAQQGSRELKMLLADPEVKQDIKEAMELWYDYKYQKKAAGAIKR